MQPADSCPGTTPHSCSCPNILQAVHAAKGAKLPAWSVHLAVSGVVYEAAYTACIAGIGAGEKKEAGLPTLTLCIRGGVGGKRALDSPYSDGGSHRSPFTQGANSPQTPRSWSTLI